MVMACLTIWIPMQMETESVTQMKVLVIQIMMVSPITKIWIRMVMEFLTSMKVRVTRMEMVFQTI